MRVVAHSSLLGSVNVPLLVRRQSDTRGPNAEVEPDGVEPVLGHRERLHAKGSELLGRAAQLGDVPAAEWSPADGAEQYQEQR
jgi:hypothetical protein